MLISEKVRIKWCGTNRKWYESLGYKFTKINDYLLVDVNDLMKGTATKITVQCDYCGSLISREYRQYLLDKKIINKDACSDCISLKSQESNLKIYGVRSVLSLKENIEKRQQTNMERYGVKNPFECKEIQEKFKQKNIEKYGTPYPFQLEEFQLKQKETLQKKYGVDHYSKSDEFRTKHKNTMLERYGVEHALQNEEIKNKAHTKRAKTVYENGQIPTSMHQIHICNLVKGVLNYPIDACNLDISFPDEKIYIEFDGGGHDLKVKLGLMTEEEFRQKEIKRYYFIKSKGWKQIKIISDEKLPSDDTIIEMLNYAKDYLNLGHSWIEFNINNSTIKTSEFKKDFDYGKLKSFYLFKKDFLKGGV